MANLQNFILKIRELMNYNSVMLLDSIDLQVLDILQNEGRITNAELASRVGLTPAPMLARVNKLEERGYIRRYVALLDPVGVGLNVTAFVSVILHAHGRESATAFLSALSEIPEVVECHHIAGQEDYLLKVMAASPSDYERLVLEKITAIPAVQRVKTTIVLSTPKSVTQLPIRVAESERSSERSRR